MGGVMDRAVGAHPMAGPSRWRMPVIPLAAPVLVHDGTPCSRHLYGPWVADAAGSGLRLIGYDRPGYAPAKSTSLVSTVPALRPGAVW